MRCIINHSVAFLMLLSAPLAGCGAESTAPSVAPSPAPIDAYTAFGQETAVVLSGHEEDAMEPFLSKDGQTLFFNNSNAPTVNTDLFYATRVNDTTFASQGRIAGANSGALDGVASMDVAGNFYFISTRSYDTSRSSLYTASFAGGALAAPELVESVSRREPGIIQFDAEISSDGQFLWFVDGRFTGGAVPESAQILLAEKQAAGFVRRSDSNILLQTVNAVGLNFAPAISTDGLELFFTRITNAQNPNPIIYRAVRNSNAEAFGQPQRVAAITGYVEAPSLSADGRTLYYHKRIDGRFRIFKVSR